MIKLKFIQSVEWGDSEIDIFKCSGCGETIIDQTHFEIQYCPNCGEKVEID